MTDDIPSYLLCFSPTPWHTLEELQKYLKELGELDQRAPEVQDEIKTVRHCIELKKAEQEHY